MREKEMKHMKDYCKYADELLSNLREQNDKQNNAEKNRVQFLRSKGCDVFKVIQDDKIFTERGNRERSANNRTPNNKPIKLDISHGNIGA
jgi:hypothetical protein